MWHRPSQSSHSTPAERRGPTALALTAALLAFAPAATTAQQHAAAPHPHPAGDLGTVDFRVACAEEVRDDFDGAVALLHHMMYERARERFEAVAQRDPECGMAHWGVAMSHIHPLWHPADEAALSAAREALEHARASGIRSERERALVDATAALVTGDDVGWWQRLGAWADAMESPHERHPDDPDVAAFYALSQLAAGQPAEDRARYNERAARVLLAVHERNPTHPGAAHYTIHANDVTGRAGRSMDVVASYRDIAPDVPHALHMPTHIYVRVGDWPQVIDWNRRSADAALDHPAGDRVSLHWIHALDYMMYAYLQQAADGRARAVLDEVRDGGRLQENFTSAYHLAALPARLAVERRDWAAAANVTARTPAYIEWDRSPWPEAMSWFARGLGAAHTGDLEGAREAESRMAALRQRAEETGQTDHAGYIEIDRLILAGHIAAAEGADEEGVQLMRRAAELESSLEKHPVSPGAILPPNEALGELLLDLDRPAEALAAFERSLEVWPGRYNSLLGAARAAVAADDDERATHHYRQLLGIVDADGADRPGIDEARRALAGTDG